MAKNSKNIKKYEKSWENFYDGDVGRGSAKKIIREITEGDAREILGRKRGKNKQTRKKSG